MMPTYGTYFSTKAAVEQLTRVFAKEVGQRGVTVNSISPGPPTPNFLPRARVRKPSNNWLRWLRSDALVT